MLEWGALPVKEQSQKKDLGTASSIAVHDLDEDTDELESMEVKPVKPSHRPQRYTVKVGAGDAHVRENSATTEFASLSIDPVLEEGVQDKGPAFPPDEEEEIQLLDEDLAMVSSVSRPAPSEEKEDSPAVVATRLASPSAHPPRKNSSTRCRPLQCSSDEDESEDVEAGPSTEARASKARILLMNSMSMGRDRCSAKGKLVQEYLSREWENKKNLWFPGAPSIDFSLLPVRNFKVPQQENGCDCGVHILENMERSVVDFNLVLECFTSNNLEKWYPRLQIRTRRQWLRRTLESRSGLSVDEIYASNNEKATRRAQKRIALDDCQIIAEENPSSLTEEQSLILAERVQEQTSLFDEDDFQVPPRTTRSQASSTARILGTSSSLSDPPTTRNTRGKVFQEKTISQAKEEPDVHCSENSCEEEDADLCGAVPATPSKPPTEEIK